jgi:hypothetical protein
MSVQLVGVDTLGAAKVGHQPLATRMIAIVVGVAHKIADEVVYTIREDFRHGRISRDPKDWER